MIQYNINIKVETDDNGDIIRVGLVDECADCTSSYWTAKTALSETSGLPADASTKDHIAAIKLKAYDEGYDKGWHDKQADIQKRIKQFEEAIKETIENE